MQQHLLAENYPGLLDGLTTSQVFEDHWTQVQGSLDCRVLMHYFWPTSPLTLPGPRGRAAQRAVPDGRLAAAGLGQQPDQPGQPLRAEGAAVRRRPHGARADRERRLRAAAGAALEPGRPTRPASAAASPTSCARSSASPSRPTRRTARAGSRSTTSASSTGCSRCSAARSRRSSSSTSTPRSAGSTSTATSSRSAPTADPDALRIAYETGRVNSGTGAADIPEIDNRTGAQGDDTGFHPAVPLVLLPRAAGQGQRPPRQPGDLALARRAASCRTSST